MTMDTSNFFRRLPERKRIAPDRVLEVTTKITLDAFGNVVRGTPVDTGHARGGWQVETPTRPFQNGVITNAVSYMKYLIYGHSDQAPNGWLRAALRAAARSWRK